VKFIEFNKHFLNLENVNNFIAYIHHWQ